MGTTGIVEPIDIFEQRFTKFILVMVGMAVGFLVFKEFEKNTPLRHYRMDIPFFEKDCTTLSESSNCRNAKAVYCVPRSE